MPFHARCKMCNKHYFTTTRTSLYSFLRHHFEVCHNVKWSFEELTSKVIVEVVRKEVYENYLIGDLTFFWKAFNLPKEQKD